MSLDPHHPILLVVDDDPDTRELYRILLESVGYRVYCAGDVRTAAALASRTTPHVVVTDWRLPDGDGFAVCAALHARTASRHVPIVAVSGLSMEPAMVADARARGITSVLVKPAAPDDILRAVRVANEIGTARQLRAAAQRFRRYAAKAARCSQRRPANPFPIDAGALVSRAVARSGENITLLIADDTARCVAVGGSTRALTGYDPQELLSLSVWDLTAPPDKSVGPGLWSSFIGIASGTHEGRYMLQRRDGVPVEAQYCAIANIVPGLHVSAVTEASQMPASL